MGWFSKKSTPAASEKADATELDALRGHVADLTARLEEADRERVKVAKHLALVDQMLAAKADPTPVNGTPRPATTGEPVNTAALDERFAAIDQRLTSVDETNQQTAYRLAALDDRMSGIGTELTNQLTELGRDIDALADLPSMQPGAPGAPTGGLSPEQLERITDGQTKLAKEQVRYEIAFREELATLAEQVRRNTSR